MTCVSGEGLVPKQTHEVEKSKRSSASSRQGHRSAQATHDAMRDVIGGSLC